VTSHVMAQGMQLVFRFSPDLVSSLTRLAYGSFPNLFVTK